ncbi:MAG: putative ABC transporter permease, partial [Clostridia bacterium]|nr:putative ABC transporter permease [Clostridia bacterium]
FLGSLLLASGIEFLTGWALEKLFHTKWWDYSEKPLNIHGYVCLRMSVLWGVACVIIVNSLYPLTVTIAEMIPQVAVIVMLAVFFILGAIDMAATLAAISQMSEKLAMLTEIAGEIHQVSDEIGHVISDSTLTAKRKASEGGALFTEKAQRFNELKDEKLAEFNDLKTGAAEKFKAAAKRMMALNERMLHLIGDMNGVQRRILKAFPTMKSSHYTEAMTALKAFYRRHRRENQE